jgi:hypothetical protein
MKGVTVRRGRREDKVGRTGGTKKNRAKTLRVKNTRPLHSTTTAEAGEGGGCAGGLCSGSGDALGGE